MSDKQCLEKLPAQPKVYAMFIDGQWTGGVGSAQVVRSSPAHDVPVSIYPSAQREDVEQAVAAARQAFDDGRWSQVGGEVRAEVLLKVARLIRERSDALALRETLETGKPISQARGEIQAAAGIWEYAAGQARALHGDSFNNLGGGLLGLVTREPIGVVGLITPWNFPFFILAERLPFILASGCTLVVKPSELTSGSTLELAAILEEAGLPAGVVNVVTGSGSRVGQAISEHMDVDMVSFTGSTEVGRLTLAAAAGNMKKVGLELGGKNPQVVFADADLDAAADAIVFGICFNAGQCCVSGSRLLVQRSVADALVDRLLALIGKVRIGDPLDESTQVGSITEARHLERILAYIEQGKGEGARLLHGGKRIASPAGLYVEPTLFADVVPEMVIAREEIFGPVLTITVFDDFEQAMQLANDTPFGLAASIWTRDLDTSLRAVRAIKAGRVWVNTTITGGPELPSGGFKQSGIGRETGRYGVEEYTELKSVHVQIGDRPRWVEA
ncbi:sorbosone dehydrogenase [Pseudomonas daroniae]|uniref:Sorbosone dehydrogenase n=1 Tax=Phytopseudomonas daroniae TaxID=2487519 RepID=A0A4Q9QI61_9GAMM|nr:MULTISPECIES: aldehyde dehydrogenase family protein [Pseudomonas]TBU73408.1 sorbosone dehydrogenase [Pseudomonas daroniae]TBU79160.1 sorbosone dehydrogenase [Pseudomonas sp. FRB 228]TBU88058.1 sorbosone dehydrogenase [Pseudomonas daroniae]